MVITRCLYTTVCLRPKNSPLSEKPREFIQIDRLLRKHHFGAPKIYAKNLRHGFLLLEYLGNTPLSVAMQTTSKSNDFYILALDTLIKIQKDVTEYTKLPLGLPVMQQEHNLFIDYYVPKILGISLSQKALQEFHTIWNHLFKELRKLPVREPGQARPDYVQ